MPEIKKNRNFGFIMTGGFLLVGLVIPLIKHNPFHLSLLVLAVIFFLFAVFTPQFLEKPRLWWLRLGEKLGIINTRILFTLIYLTIFSFVHLIFKILQRDKMKRKWKKYATTYQVKTKISSFDDPF